MRAFLLLLAVFATALVPGSAAAEPPAGAPGCPSGFFGVTEGVEPGTPPDRNGNGRICSNGDQVFIDDRVGGVEP